MNRYYAQFDKEDLDEWQGKPPQEEDDDDDDYKRKEEEDFVPCMDHYGLDWRMFS